MPLNSRGIFIFRKMIKLPLHLIELDENNFHLVVESSVNNEKIFWIIDTGASKSVFDINLNQYYTLVESKNDEEFQSAGITSGKVETKLGSISFEIGKLQIDNLTVALLDLNHVKKIYKKYTNQLIGGLLGGDVLNKYKCCIDYMNRTITFNQPQ